MTHQPSKSLSPQGDRPYSRGRPAELNYLVSGWSGKRPSLLWITNPSCPQQQWTPPLIQSDLRSKRTNQPTRAIPQCLFTTTNVIYLKVCDLEQMLSRGWIRWRWKDPINDFNLVSAKTLIALHSLIPVTSQYTYFCFPNLENGHKCPHISPIYCLYNALVCRCNTC